MRIEIDNSEYWEICKERDFCGQQLSYCISQMERFFRLVYEKKHSPRDVVNFGKFVEDTSKEYQDYMRMLNKKFDERMSKNENK